MPLSDLEGARGRTEVFSIFELLLVFSHVLGTPARQVRNTSTSLQHSSPSNPIAHRHICHRVRENGYQSALSGGTAVG